MGSHFIQVVPSDDFLSTHKIHFVDSKKESTQPCLVQGNITINDEWEQVFSQLIENPPFLQVLVEISDATILPPIPSNISEIKIVIYKTEFGFDKYMVWMRPDIMPEIFMDEIDKAEILSTFTASFDNSLKPFLSLFLHKTLI